MTSPRQVLPGTTYLVTRRCSQRQFLLRPIKPTNAVLGFVLAVAARRFGVEVHAYCVMSNHYHMVLTDPRARLPAFCQYLDSLVARAMNSILGRRESFWSPSSFSAVTLVGPRDILGKVAYTLANPVTAGLVRRGQLWPGLWSAPARIGGEAIEFRRPPQFFRAAGVRALPERAPLILSVPPGFASRSHFTLALEQALGKLESVAASKMAGEGRPTLPDSGATVLVNVPGRLHLEGLGGLRPRIACRDRWKRIEALRRLKSFLLAYRVALRRWRLKDQGVIFPAGTYLMRVSHAANCAAST
jgi:putative transposase